jgi:hypothetical protein
MNENRLAHILERIERKYSNRIEKGARNYTEVNLGEQAAELGYDDLRDCYRDINAIVPLKSPEEGMKVRIDGRTFVNYAENTSGIAVPGFIVRERGNAWKTFIPQDSMICNFT